MFVSIVKLKSISTKQDKQILDNSMYRNTVLPYHTIRFILCQVHARSLLFRLYEINIITLLMFGCLKYNLQFFVWILMDMTYMTT